MGKGFTNEIDEMSSDLRGALEDQREARQDFGLNAMTIQT